MVRKDLHEDNRTAWNAATDAHNSHKADQVKFFREGGSTLFPEEIELVRDVRGQTLLHLQCNSGQDTLSWAQRGARVTGVDISDSAIAFASQLSADSGIPGTFHRADIYDWLADAAQRSTRYDVVFSSYGAIVWLSDIQTWAKGISAVLKPGGRFVLVEFHPFINLYEMDLTPKYSYNSGGRYVTWEEGIGDYVALTGPVLAPSGYLEGVKEFKNPHRCHEFSWGIGEVVSALIESGLTITTLKEYTYANGYKPFSEMRELPDRRFTMPEGTPDLPLMFSVAAGKGH